MTVLCEPLEGDWTAIGQLANEAVRHIPGAPQQAEWLRNRIGFRGARRHWVATSGTRIVGYGGLERGEGVPRNECRLFLVVPWSQPGASEIADQLLSRLHYDAALLREDRLWVREYASDARLIQFLLARGFKIVDDYVQDDMRVLNLACNESARAQLGRP